MIKHGTKYINESEWFDEVELSDLYDESTGRFKRNPPLGTRVRVVIPGYGGDEGKEITGEVVKYYNDKEDLRLKDIVFALMLDGGWQQEFGWGCDQEWGLRKYDGKCYWIDVEDDEVYLEKPPLPVVDIVESEGDDDLEWASNAINNLPPIFNVTQTVDGKDYRIDEQSKMSWIESLMEWNESELSKDGTKILQMGGSFSPSYALKFYLERGGYVLLGDGSVSYIVDDVVELSTAWDEHTGAWDMVKKFLLSLQVRMPLNESEDDLEWAQDAIDNPEYRYGDIVNDLDNDDIISLTGIITDSEGNPMVEVRDSEFRVYKLSSRRDGKYVHLQWSQPSDERPSNWDDIGATVIMSPETFEWDKDLRVKLIHKENHPF